MTFQVFDSYMKLECDNCGITELFRFKREDLPCNCLKITNGWKIKSIKTEDWTEDNLVYEKFTTCPICAVSIKGCFPYDEVTVLVGKFCCHEYI